MLAKQPQHRQRGGDLRQHAFAPLPAAAAQLARLAAIIGRDFETNAVRLSAEREGVRLTGWAGLPTFNKGTSAYQYLFVNGRPVRDRLLQGALRGYKDVHVTFLLAVLSFWVIGLPAGWGLAHYTLLGPYGYWIGLIAGIMIGAVCLVLRLRSVQRRYEQECH